jgi:hypothetical protein
MVDASDIYLAKAAPEKIEQHLKRPINATIGTLNADGSIHLAFVLFLWEGSKLYFETASMMKKARNVAARSTASFAIEGGPFQQSVHNPVKRVFPDEIWICRFGQSPRLPTELPDSSTRYAL